MHRRRGSARLPRGGARRRDGHHRLDEDHRRVGAGAQGVQGIRAAPLGRDTRLAREAVPGRRVSGSLRADHRAA